MNWILATVLAASVSGGATFKGQLTVGANTTGAASGTAPAAAGGGGGGALALATLRYNADDLSLAAGDKVSSWPSTGTDSDSTATLVGRTSPSDQPHFNIDAEMGNSVYFDTYPSPPNGTGASNVANYLMKTATLATPIDMPTIICMLVKSDTIKQESHAPHYWEGGREAGATTASLKIQTYSGSRLAMRGNYAALTEYRAKQNAWVTICSEMNFQAPSRMAMNGSVVVSELINRNNYLPEQTKMIDFGIGGAHGTSTSVLYGFSGKIADVAIWSDYPGLSVTLAGAAKEFTELHGLFMATPGPSDPLPYELWDAMHACDLGNQQFASGGTGCSTPNDVPQGDGCDVRYAYGNGIAVWHPSSHSSYLSAVISYGGAGRPCEVNTDLPNGHPYIIMESSPATEIRAMQQLGTQSLTIPQPWSQCMVYKILSNPANGTKRYLFSHTKDDRDTDWFIDVDGGGTATLKIYQRDTATTFATTSLTTTATGKWSALCVEYDGAGSEWTLLEEGGSAISGTHDPWSGIGRDLANGATYFFGEYGGRKTLHAAWTKIVWWDESVDQGAMVSGFATQYGL